MPEFTFIFAGVLGVGKTTIFKRIETGEFVQTPAPTLANSKSDSDIENYIYVQTIHDKEYKVSIHLALLYIGTFPGPINYSQFFYVCVANCK